jgi:curved DNA-binding protein CbpA
MINLLHTDSPYKVLGVEPSASEAEIKQAYFDLVREHSPEHDPEGFKRIRAAYEKLRAGGERAATDLFLIDERGGGLSDEKLRRFAADPPPVTPELIRGDLIVLEAVLLLEEAVGARKQA